jgi:hypothetical protein
MYQVNGVELLDPIQQRYNQLVGGEFGVVTVWLLLHFEFAKVHALGINEHLNVVIAFEAGNECWEAILA